MASNPIKRRNEKGSITLFVLMAILFFIIFALNIFTQSKTSKTVQQKQIEKIEKEYTVSAEDIEMKYQEIVEDYKNAIQIAVETIITQTDGTPIDEDENYDEVLITINITDKDELANYEITMQDENRNNISAEATSDGDAGFIVPGVGKYTIYITVIENGVERTTTRTITLYAQWEKILPVGATEITNNPQKYYGGIVSNYTVDESVEDENIEWRIFHADDTNIYLIASDYIQIANAPSKTVNGTTYSLNTGNNEYTGYFANIRQSGAYSGSANITDSRIKQLNNSYFNEANNGLGYTSTSSNMICVAYMLDIDIWNRYAMAGKAEYAIGAPTIELLLDSYNNKYSTNYLTEAVSANGYQISKDNGENWEITCTKILNKDDDLYVVNKGSKIDAFWLASPSGDTVASNRPMLANADGSIARTTYNNMNIGFRPIVCLKSDVQLKEQPDGTYKITDVL